MKRGSVPYVLAVALACCVVQDAIALPMENPSERVESRKDGTPVEAPTKAVVNQEEPGTHDTIDTPLEAAGHVSRLVSALIPEDSMLESEADRSKRSPHKKFGYGGGYPYGGQSYGGYGGGGCNVCGGGGGGYPHGGYGGGGNYGGGGSFSQSSSQSSSSSQSGSWGKK